MDGPDQNSTPSVFPSINRRDPAEEVHTTHEILRCEAAMRQRRIFNFITSTTWPPSPTPYTHAASPSARAAATATPTKQSR